VAHHHAIRQSLQLSPSLLAKHDFIAWLRHHQCAEERNKSTNKSAGERYKITLQKRLGALYVKITKSALGRAIKIHH